MTLPFLVIEARGSEGVFRAWLNVSQVQFITQTEQEGVYRIWLSGNDPLFIDNEQFEKILKYVSVENAKERLIGMPVMRSPQPGGLD